MAISLSSLAELYTLQRRYGEAEPLYQQALQMRQKLLGDEHPAVATSLHNLAFLYKSQRRFQEAESLLLKALAICDRLLGPQHPDTISTRKSLENLKAAMNRKS